MVDSNHSQKSPLKAPFRQNKLYGLSYLQKKKKSYMDLVFARGAFLRFFGAPNESLRLIIIFWQQTNFGIVTSDPKSPLKARFRQN